MKQMELNLAKLFAYNLRRLRLGKELEYEELGRKVRMTPKDLAALEMPWLSPKAPNFSLDLISRLAKTLKCLPYEFLQPRRINRDLIEEAEKSLRRMIAKLPDPSKPLIVKDMAKRFDADPQDVEQAAEDLCNLGKLTRIRRGVYTAKLEAKWHSEGKGKKSKSKRSTK